MRLTGLYLNGFGIFHDVKVEELSPELTVFYGRNESGKSTLLGFLRAILFGFPDGRSSENLYPPLKGGRHGGNITLLTDDREELVLERSPGPRGGKVKVLKSGQALGDKAFLNHFLGMASRSLFKNVYAFSLTELQTFETLNTESVNEALYSAGAGIDPAGLTRLKSSLEKRENELFRRGGSKPAINVILLRLANLAKEKKALSESVEEYDALRTRIGQISRSIQTTEEKKLDLSIQFRKAEQWIALWPEWLNLDLINEKLAELEPIDEFPRQGLARFEALKSRLGDMENGLLEKKGDLERQESELSGIKTDLGILSLASSIRQLQRDEGRFEAATQEIGSVKRAVKSAEQKLNQSVERLGSSWTVEKVSAFNLSIATLEEIRKYRDTIRQAELEMQKRKELLEDLEREKQGIDEVIRSLPKPPIQDPERLAEMKRANQRLVRMESRSQLVERELGYIRERLEDLEREKQNLNASFLPKKPIFPVCIAPATTAIGLMLLAWLGYHGQWVWAFSAGTFFSIMGTLLSALRSRLMRRTGDRNLGVERQMEHLVMKASDLESKGREFQQELDQIQTSALDDRSILGLSEADSGEALERMDVRLEEETRQVERLKEASDRLDRVEIRQKETLDALQRAQSAGNEIKRKWEDWLEKRDLEPVLSPDGAMETLSMIDSCKEQVEHLALERSRLEALNRTMADYLNQINEVLAHRGGNPVDEGEVQAAAQTLIHEYTEAEKAAQKSALLSEEIKASQGSVDRLQGQLNKTQKEIQELIAASGAKNEDQFRERAVVYEKRIALRRDRERYEGSVKRLSGSLGDLPQVDDFLSKTDRDELENRRAKLEKEVKELDATLEQRNREQARLEEQTRQLLDDEKLTALRSEEESLKERLLSHSEEWSTVKLAQALMGVARGRYERERQPDVIRKAGVYFNRLTLGKYPSVLAPLGEDRIEVVCQDNSRKDIGHLSRGTAEQLYLSLRFGFIHEYSKRSESLPIVMDEILVNFDQSRAKATIGAILELSKQNQVVFFTCHPEMTSLFKEADPQIPIFEISKGTIEKTNG